MNLNSCSQSKPVRSLLLLLLPVLGLCSQRAYADSDADCYKGIPNDAESPHKLTLLDREGFTIGYCEEWKCPAWACYRLEADPQVHSFPRLSFKTDREIHGASPNSYSKTGFDRGHLAPNFAIMTRYGRQAQSATFLMSNVTPMRPKINRGIWRQLEMRVADKYANQFGEIWVTAGPIFDDEPSQMENGVEIPDSFYKVLIDQAGDGPRALAFIFPHEPDTVLNLADCLVSIDQVEEVTGLDLFHELDDAHEIPLEAGEPENLWR